MLIETIVSRTEPSPLSDLEEPLSKEE